MCALLHVRYTSIKLLKVTSHFYEFEICEMYSKFKNITYILTTSISHMITFVLFKLRFISKLY